jgi:ATP-dependent RNA helicase RhlE
LVEGFDYNVAAPKKDVEFARSPRPPQQRRKPADGAPKSAPRTAQAAKPHVANEKVAPTGNQPPKHRNNRSQRGH